MSYTEKELAILDAHDITDDDGNVIFALTPEVLGKIAANNNRLVKETGDEIPIVIGHTDDKLPQSQQPEIVGWARNFKVKKLFGTGRKAIFCTAKFLKDKVNLAAKYPRRSVEVWLKRLLIDPISLLGATSPERHLGVLKFSGGEQTYSTLSPSEEPMNQDTDSIVQAVLAALKESDVWKWAESQMSESAPGDEEGMDNEAPPIPSPDEMSKPPPPDESATVPPEEPVRQSASTASSGNTMVPGELEKVKMQAHQLNGHLLKFQAAYKQAWERTQDLEMKLRRVEREKDLIKLDAKGISFDIAEELETVTPMEEDEYAKHLVRMEKRYVRAPVSDPLRLAANQPRRGPNAPSGRSKEEATAVFNYALANQLTYEEAATKLSANKERVF